MKYLTGLLNSKLIAFWLRHNGKMQGSHYQVDKEPLLNIPLLNASASIVEVIRKFVDFIITLKSIEENRSDKSTFSMMIRYFEQIIDAVVYESYFGEEFHNENREFIKLLLKEELPFLEGSENRKMVTIEKIYNRLFARDHPIRQGIFYLDSNETVRVIEDKYENPKN